MKLWEVIKLINEDKIPENTLFLCKGKIFNATLEFEDGRLFYSEIGNDTTSKGSVNLDFNELTAEYEMILPKQTKEVIHFTKMIKIKNGIGVFKEDYIDSVSVIVEGHSYELVPIDGKIAVPRVQNGEVMVIYKQYKDVLKYNV